MSIKKKKKQQKESLTMAVTIWTSMLEKGLKGSLIRKASQGLGIFNELKNLDAKS